MDPFLTTMAVVLFGMAAVSAAFARADQRRLWYRLNSWRFRHPERHEPSPAALTRKRGSRVMFAVLAAATGLYTLLQADELGPSSPTPDYSDSTTTYP